MTEKKLLLPMVVQRFRLRVVARQTVEFEPIATLRPRHGLPMALNDRTRIEPGPAV